jgi:hypothetical protein
MYGYCRDMNKRLTLTRDGKTVIVVVREDTEAVEGKKFKYGSGKCWIVAKVEEA